jgi:acetyltransferase-like isoleucine patch superfamily enzyme
MASGYQIGARFSERWRDSARQWLLAGTAELDPTCRIYASARLECLGGDPAAIRVGAHTQVRGQLLTAAHAGRISLGEWCYIGEGSRLWSAMEIRVGDRVLISHGCEIHDWNAHPLDPKRRHEQFREIVERGHPRHIDAGEAAPVLIADDAWIGFGSTIMKGVRIGARSVVASRSLVLADVPDDTLVAGSPAKPVRQLP